MIKADFKDIYGSQIEVYESSSGYFRLDFKGESFPPKKDDVSGQDIPVCISLKEDEARVLQSCLNSYFKD